MLTTEESELLIGIIRVRKGVLDAAVALRDRGEPPPGMDPASFLIRPASVRLPKDVAWVEAAKVHLVAHAVARAASP